jgi:hypothetical protein
MERKQAEVALESWYELAERDPRFSGAYQALGRLLRTCLPDDVSAVAGALVDGRPAVVAIAGDGLFLVTLEDQDGEDVPHPVVERLPLAPIQPTLRIRDEWRDEAPRGPFAAVSAQVRQWKLAWADGRVVVFESVARRSGGWHDGPDLADGVGRELAAKLGWTLPDSAG